MPRKSKEVAIENTTEAWENRKLGCDARFAKPLNAELGTKVDRALGLETISIRVEKDLIKSFKILEKKYNTGHQRPIREALKRFINSELKK